MAYKPQVLKAIEGGTGQNTYNTGDILYSSASNILSKLPAGAAGQILSLVSGVPAWVTYSSVVDYIDAVLVATTANLNATYLNGVSGVGATLVNAGTLAAFTVDGQTPAINSRVLVKNQSSTFQNGVYTLTTVGSGAVAWVLTRSLDYNTPSEINPGDVVPVQTGTVNANTSWLQGSTVTTIGTDPITFTQFQSAPISLPLSLANGGTGASLSSSNGGIFYSNASSGAILSGTATANQVLMSGASTTPAWSTATYPATTTANQLLYSSATNTVAGLATTNNGILSTNGSGVPSVTTASGNWNNTSRCAFLYYQASVANNATGAGAVYTVGSSVALTKVFDQGNNMTTGGTFTAPVTGKYFLSFTSVGINATIGTQWFVKIVTTARTYFNGFTHVAGNIQNQANVNSLCDMTAGDTATFTVQGTGEAGNTQTVYGSSEMDTYMSGYLVC